MEKTRYFELVKKLYITSRNTKLSCKIKTVKEKQKSRPEKKDGKSCLWCSGTFNDRSMCPSINNRCIKCRKLGLFGKVWCSQAMKKIKAESSANSDLPRDNPCFSRESIYFLRIATHEQFDINRPTIDVYGNNVKIKFLMDIRVEVTVNSKETF